MRVELRKVLRPAICVIAVLALALPSFGGGNCTVSFGYAGHSCLGESGYVDINHYGQCNSPGGLPALNSRCDQWPSEDDCDNECSDHHFAKNEWTWTLVTQPGCNWTVQSTYMATALSAISLIVDNTWDCDFASAHGKLWLRNDEGAGGWGSPHTHYLERTDAGVDDDKQKTLSRIAGGGLKTCVGNGTAFSGSSWIEGKTYVKSEAYANVNLRMLGPVTSNYISTLCE